MQFMNGATLIGVAAAGAFAAAVVIWFILRRKLQRLWLPILKIVRRMPRRMPRVRLIKPPVVPFLCFAACGCMLVFLALAPAREVLKPLSHQENRFHVFIDLSPSVSAYASIEQVRDRVGQLWQQLRGEGQMTFSTSASETIVQPSDEAEFAEFRDDLQFQRGGSRLGSVFKQQLTAIGKVSRLYLISDADAFSWGDFNWQFLTADHDLIYLPLNVRVREQRRNVFFGQVKFIDDPLSTRVTWELEIVATVTPEASGGVVSATYLGRTLATKEWEIPAGAKQARILIDWPALDMPDDARRDAPIVFKLDPATPDAMELDNEFRVTMRGARRSAVVISEPAGEMTLEDPIYHLQNSLQVMGYELERFDYVTQPGPDPLQYALMVLAGGGGKGVDFFCPRSITETRSRHQASGAVLPMVWLVPRTFRVDYGELCHCFARLTASEGALSRPAYCNNIDNRDAWVAVLASLGAKQVGGGLGEERAAIAWQKVDPQSGLDVMAFTLPLAPSRYTGIGYASMPLLLKELLTWKGQLSDGRDDGEGWPRVNDVLTTDRETARVTASDLVREQILLSNVPIGESLLAQIDAAGLPPVTASAELARDRSMAAARVKLDPVPFVRMMLLVVLAAMLAEIVWYLLRLLARRRKSAALLYWLAFSTAGGTAAGLLTTPARAQVRLALLGYGPTLGTHTGVSELAREVAQRTSIDLSPEALLIDKVSPPKLSEPWLWVRNPTVLTTQSSQFRNEFLLWLKNGGFAVIEDTADMAPLEAFTTKAFANEPYAVQWQTIPPDHELMRSFHLLDSLPSCQGKLWRGLHFDGRLAAVAVPYRFLDQLLDKKRPAGCELGVDQERLVRVYINLLMVVLATDYKKDQIHLPEILKRLR